MPVYQQQCGSVGEEVKSKKKTEIQRHGKTGLYYINVQELVQAGVS